MRRRSVRIAVAVAGCVLLLALSELALRARGFFYPPFLPTILWNPFEDRALRLGNGLHRPDARQFWTPRPSASIPWGEDEIVNAAGYRGPLVARERTEGTLRIVTLGDSSTFGHSVRYDETFTAELARLLGERGRAVEALDAGVVGYTTFQMLERYRVFVRPYRPDVVIAAITAVNDHWPALQFVDDEQKLAQPVELGGRWTLFCIDVRRDLRLAHGFAWLVDRAADGRDAERDRTFRRDRYEQFLIRTLGESEWKGTRRVSVDQFERRFRELVREVRADGARLVVLAMPRWPGLERSSPVLERYSRRLESVAAELGVELVDGRAAFVERESAGADPHALWAADEEHPNAAGHALLARLLCEGLAR